LLPGYKLFGAIDIYYSFHVLGFVVLTAFALWASGKYHIPRWKIIVLAAVIYAATYTWMLLLYWIASGFKSFGGQNIVRVFIWMPLFTFLCSRALKVNWLDVADISSVTMTVNFGIAHVGCIFAGCCYGYESSGLHIYNAIYNRYLFPVQLFESATALAIAVFLIWRMKKTQFITNGELYPLMMMLFGSTRFIWEFFRDNEKLFFGISNLAIHALIMGVVGTAWYLTIRDRNANKQLRRKH
jgi:phosphatidylglycerol:prolipoprotein diacylglycerol transferase